MHNFSYSGAIVRIRLKNFMTYDDVELWPGPNLNMILGPNGTGKSAIVCSIIVGLAGEVSLTGRAATPADFIKKDREFAETEIELHNDSGDNYIVHRAIKITKRTQYKNEHESSWKINSVIKLKKDVQNLMRELNIKVDNLCQFLPQDSVTQFVKMNTIELLIDTLKAAGDNKLVDDHQTLVTRTKQIEEAKKDLQNRKQKTKENQANKQRLQTEVNQFEQREQLVKKKNTINAKIYYQQYLEKKRVYEEAKSRGSKHKSELKSLEKECIPTRRALDKFNTEESTMTKSIEKSRNDVEKCSNLIKDYQDKMESLRLNCAEENARFRDAEMEEKNRQNNVTLKKEEMENLKRKLDEIQVTERVEEIKKELNDQLGRLKDNNRELLRNKDKIDDALSESISNTDEARKELSHIKAVKEKKMELLKNKYPDAYKTVNWYCNNKDKFSGKVYLPLMIEINVKDNNFSRVVEHAISRQDFSAFVCECPEDVTTLTRAARDVIKVKINVILAPNPSRDRDFASEIPDLSDHGIDTYLKDLIEAPEPIIRYLCASNQFHRIPVGTNLSEKNIKWLLDHVPKFYSDDSFYNSSRSRYDKEQMIVKDIVREPQHLRYTLDTTKLAKCTEKITRLGELQKKLRDERGFIETKINATKQEYGDVSAKLNSLLLKAGEKDRIRDSIKRLKADLERLESTSIDIQREREKLQTQIKKINAKSFDILEKIVKLSQDFIMYREHHLKETMRSQLANYNRRLAFKRLKNAEEKIETLKDEIKRFQRSLNVYLEAFKECEKIAETKITGFKDGQLDEEVQAKFDEISTNDIETLKQIKNDLSAQIDSVPRDDGDILEAFKTICQELMNNSEQIEALERTIKEYENQRDRISGDWRSRLNEVISDIDKNYRNFMSKLNYGGQVKLDHQDANDFASYGISIMVRYRDNEDLIPLSSTRQSGGERSVATMIYMLALQTRTTVPFRCVDEINQGMDKDNERKVFELLVDTADTSSSQYFLVSPKLLPNLAYSDKMSIHVIYNGRHFKAPWTRDVIEMRGKNGVERSSSRPSASKRLKSNHRKG